MSQMFSEKNKELNEYQLTDLADDQQITQEGVAVEEAFLYKNKKSELILSWPGIRQIVLQKADKGEPIQTNVVDVHLEKRVAENPDTWTWYATVKSRNLKTGNETFGMSESPYYFNRSYDWFGRTKASTKAERNADYKQITDEERKDYVNSVKQKNIMDLSGLNYDNRPVVGNAQTVEKTSSSNNQVKTDSLPTQKQVVCLKSLKWPGRFPKTKESIGNLIQYVRMEGMEQAKKDDRWNELLSNVVVKPTNEQLKKLTTLGYNGAAPFSQSGASDLIGVLERKNAVKNTDKTPQKTVA